MLNVQRKNGVCLIEINFVGLDLLAGKRNFNLNLLQLIQTGSGVHHTFYSVGTSDSFPGGTVGWG